MVASVQVGLLAVTCSQRLKFAANRREIDNFCSILRCQSRASKSSRSNYDVLFVQEVEPSQLAGRGCQRFTCPLSYLCTGLRVEKNSSAGTSAGSLSGCLIYQQASCLLVCEPLAGLHQAKQTTIDNRLTYGTLSRLNYT